MTTAGANAGALLAVDSLCVNFGSSRVVNHVSFNVAAGEKFGLVGESGSGKSVTALSILQLLETATYEGAIRFEGEDVLTKIEPGSALSKSEVWARGVCSMANSATTSAMAKQTATGRRRCVMTLSNLIHRGLDALG